LAGPGLINAVPLRARIESLLRDSVPGRDPEFPYAAQFTAEQIDMMRQLFPATPARAAVLVPLVERPAGLHVLLTQRASHLRHHPGQISFPGVRRFDACRTTW
jgi:hypothetical protein